jgi:hypothetical protein
MCKSSFLAGCAFVVVVAVVLWQVCAGPQPVMVKVYANLTHWFDLNVFENQELTARRLGLQRFVLVADKAENAVFAGRLSLADAIDRILAASREHHPGHLRHIARLEGGASPEERIGRNILRHFEENERLNQDEALHQRLQMQLAELLSAVLRRTQQSTGVGQRPRFSRSDVTREDLPC